MRISHFTCFLLFTLVFNFNTTGQQKKSKVNTDSLLKIASTNKSGDTIRIQAILRLSYFYKDKNITKADSFAAIALNESRQNGNKVFIAKSLDNQATIKKSLGELVESERLYFEAKPLMESYADSALLSLYYAHLGTFYQTKQQSQLSIMYLFKSLRIDEKLPKSDMRIAGTLNNLANVHQFDGNIEKAKEFYRKALTINRRIDNKRWESINYLNLGNCFNKKGFVNNDSALYYFTKGVEYGKSAEVNWVVAGSYLGLGVTYKRLGKLDSSINILQRGAKMAKSYGDEYMVQYFNTALCASLCNGGKINDAFKLWKETWNSAINKEYNSLTPELYEIGGEIHEKMGDYKTASQLHKRFAVLRDSLTSVQNQHVYEDFESRLEFERIEHEKQLELKRDSVKKEAEAKRNKIIIYFMIVVIVISTGSGLIAYRSYRQKKRSHEAISLQKAIIEEKNKEILDSIHYAKRIQRTLLPSEKYIEKAINGKQNYL